MCFETEFGLLRGREQTRTNSLHSPVTVPAFEFSSWEIEVLRKSGVTTATPRVSPSPATATPTPAPGGPSPAEELVRSKRECQYLQRRLEELVPSNKRRLSFTFNINTSRSYPSPPARGVAVAATPEGLVTITSIDIFVEGEPLGVLHSLMGLGKEERLGLKLKAELNGLVYENTVRVSDTGFLTTTTIIQRPMVFSTASPGFDYFDLDPLPQQDPGNVDHSKYAAFNLRLNLPEQPLNMGNIKGWRVTKLSVIVQQGSCNCGGGVPSHAMEVNRMLLAEGLGADLEILAKGDAVISCHAGILMAQSPVIEKMLATGHFLEGSTRKIKMPEWTQEEVKAFLAFLYYGGTDSPMKDASMNVTLFKMADYYEIKKLKARMRTLLLKRSVLKVSVDAALQMFAISRLVNDPEITRKAVDALAQRPDDEILQSELFEMTFTTAMARELFLISRKRF